MSSVEEYNMKLDVIKGITDDQLKATGAIPIGIYIQEAEFLYTWCQDDKDELIASGLDWTAVEDLPVRCGALRHAEATWTRERFSREQAEKLWLVESPKGYDLRNVIAHHFYYAFRDDISLIGRVNAILENNTHSGMIQGLYELSVLGGPNQELLTKIGFDLTLLDQAAQKADDLSPIYAAATRDREDFSSVKKIRDQAFTHLKEAVDLARQCGQYVFWRNDVRLKGYRSNYLRRLRLRSTEENTEPETAPVPGTEPETPTE
jgi:hypothetical protein